jgi:uncharacterized membrane protein YidH (DUF202 family)
MRTGLAILTVAFSLASFLHFLGRVFRNRSKGKPKASAVSLALCLVVLNPILTSLMVRGVVRPWAYLYVEWANLCVAFALLCAILRVEQQDDARAAMMKARREADALLEKMAKGVRTPRR